MMMGVSIVRIHRSTQALLFLLVVAVLCLCPSTTVGFAWTSSKPSSSTQNVPKLSSTRTRRTRQLQKQWNPPIAHYHHRPIPPSSLLLFQCSSDDPHDDHKEQCPSGIDRAKQTFVRSLLVLMSSSLLFFGDGINNDALAVTTTATYETPVGKNRYWSILESPNSSKQDIIQANEALLDYAVGTINTQYYDNTGGNKFVPYDFYRQWRSFRRTAMSTSSSSASSTNGEAATDAASYSPRDPIPPVTIPKGVSLDTRDGAVQGIRWLVGSLQDPFSKYLTREELEQELSLTGQDGFLGTGAIVEAPQQASDTIVSTSTSPQGLASSGSNFPSRPSWWSLPKYGLHKKKVLSTVRVSNLPVITAVEPDSPAERAGLVVGDRIVAIGSKSLLGRTRQAVGQTLTKYNNNNNSLGQEAELTIAKPVYAFPESSNPLVIGYRPSRVHLLPTKSTESIPSYQSRNDQPALLLGGDSIVHYQLLSSSMGSIFDHLHSEQHGNNDDGYKVGYIRLTRFSKASTNGYFRAIHELEAAGAESYIFDLRNNYGGKFQDALLLASTLIRDPHAILCYTMNSRGSFTPHEVEEYAVDQRYPGYLLSSEPSSVTLDQLRRENPKMFLADGNVDWDPPSSYASFHEQVAKRGIHRLSYYSSSNMDPLMRHQLQAQKKIVLLINEGTASSAEVFAATLHDNFRSVALVGTKTYGKGLIQHTFPTPDGGGLRLTIAEYLTPSLQHVTRVGGARYDQKTGELLGGGLKPDVFCESKHGIPANIGADLCVGIALDALEEAKTNRDTAVYPPGLFGESSQMMVKGISKGWNLNFQPRQK
eukprot:scaffold1442_cov128-Cylindrotheca_fusiformis.AAC.44